MKKFFTLLAAGSVALSLTAAALAAETSVNAGASLTANVGKNADCTTMSGVQKSRCLFNMKVKSDDVIKARGTMGMIKKAANMEKKVLKKAIKASARSMRAEARMERKMRGEGRAGKFLTSHSKSSSSWSSSMSSAASSVSSAAASSAAAGSMSSSSVSSH